MADKTQSNDGNIVVQPPETAGFSIVKLGTVYDTFTKIGNTNIANFACYKYVKTNPSDDFKNEKYLVGNNVFDTLQIENHDVDYVVTDKDYIAKESEELMKAITGNVKRRNSTVDEKIKIDFLSLGSRTSGFGSIGIGIGSEGQSKGSEKNVGPGGEKDQIVRAETVKTKELNKRMSNLFEDFDDEEPKPKANDKAEPEDDDIDGDDLLDMMDNL